MEGARRLAGGALERPNPGTMDVNAVLQAEGKIGNSPVQFLLDSGAAVSVICCDMVPVSAMRRMEPASSSTVAANGLPLDVVGQVSVPVSLSGYCVTHTFLVVRRLTVERLLGAHFLEKHRAVIDFADRRLTLGMQGDNIPVQITKDTQPDTPHSTMTIMVSSTTEVPGRSVKLISGHVNGLCTVESGLVEPHWEQNTPKHLMLGRCLSAVQEGQVTLEHQPRNCNPASWHEGRSIHTLGNHPCCGRDASEPPGIRTSTGQCGSLQSTTDYHTERGAAVPAEPFRSCLYPARGASWPHQSHQA